MSWFTRKKPMVRALGPGELASDIYRSPGLARLGKELARRRPESILDLGVSSTENVRFFSRYTTNFCIQDLFRSACDAESAAAGDVGRRSEAFRFGDLDSLELPAAKELFDVILIWDLIHYFEPAAQRPFIARLAAHCRPDALVFLIASSSAPIPLVPIQFKIDSEDSLLYVVSDSGRAETGVLRTRQIEGLMTGFEPVRFFQLRNGLQELLFRFIGVPEGSESEAADPVAV